MHGDTTELLVCLGLVVVMVLYWTYCIRSVRKLPDQKDGMTQPIRKVPKVMACSLFILMAR